MQVDNTSADKPKKQTKQRKLQAYVDIDEVELDEIQNKDEREAAMIEFIDSKQTIFRQAPLRRFFSEMIAEVNPKLSATTNTLHNYE